jgi:hypothetical protein
MRKLLLSFMACTLLCISASASSITINNPSFEIPALTCSAGPSCFQLSFTNWTGSGAAATFRPSVGAGQEFISLPDGLQVAAVSNGSSGDVFQDLTAMLAANTTYTLTFSVGQRSDVSFNAGYLVSVLANGVTLGSDTGATPASGAFTARSIIFTTGAAPAQLGQVLRIDISAPATPLAVTQADFDAFALTATPAGVPEPGVFGLTAMGLFGLLALARRARKA